MSKKIALTFDLAVTGKTRAQLEGLEKDLLSVAKQLREAKKLGDQDLYGKIKVQQSALRSELVATKKEARQQIQEFKKAKFPKGSITGLQQAYAKLRSEIELMTIAQQKSTKGQAAIANLKRLERQLAKTRKEAGLLNTSLSRSGNRLQGFGQNILAATGFTGAAFALVGVLREGGRIVKDFDQASADLAATLRKDKEEIGDLTKLAKELGATTAFTATEVLQLQNELAKIGFSEKEILNASRGVEDLSIALKADVGESAKLAGAALRAFELDANQTGRVTSLLGVSTTKTALDFERLKTGLPIAATNAKLYGDSIETVVARLGVLADRQIDSSTAGTSLRNIYIELAKKGLTWEQAMGKIQSATNKTAAANALFGKRTSTVALLLAENSDQVERLRGELTDVGDEMDKLVDQKLNSLEGKLTLLNSAWEGFVLSVEEGDGIISQAFIGMTSRATDFLNTLTRLNNGDYSFLESLSLTVLKGTTQGEVLRAQLEARTAQRNRKSNLSVEQFGSTEGTKELIEEFDAAVQALDVSLASLRYEQEQVAEGSDEYNKIQEKINEDTVKHFQATQDLAFAKANLAQLSDAAKNSIGEEAKNQEASIQALKKAIKAKGEEIDNAKLSGESTTNLEKQYGALQKQLESATAWKKKYNNSSKKNKERNEGETGSVKALNKELKELQEALSETADENKALEIAGDIGVITKELDRLAAARAFALEKSKGEASLFNELIPLGNANSGQSSVDPELVAAEGAQS